MTDEAVEGRDAFLEKETRLNVPLLLSSKERSTAASVAITWTDPS